MYPLCMAAKHGIASPAGMQANMTVGVSLLSLAVEVAGVRRFFDDSEEQEL